MDQRAIPKRKLAIMFRERSRERSSQVPALKVTLDLGLNWVETGSMRMCQVFIHSIQYLRKVAGLSECTSYCFDTFLLSLALICAKSVQTSEPRIYDKKERIGLTLKSEWSMALVGIFFNSPFNSHNRLSC